MEAGVAHQILIHSEVFRLTLVVEELADLVAVAAFTILLLVAAALEPLAKDLMEERHYPPPPLAEVVELEVRQQIKTAERLMFHLSRVLALVMRVAELVEPPLRPGVLELGMELVVADRKKLQIGLAEVGLVAW